MDSLVTWATDHWFLTFLLAYAMIHVSANLINRILRTTKILARGWPPAHLDADGDWKPKAD